MDEDREDKCEKRDPGEHSCNTDGGEPAEVCMNGFLKRLSEAMFRDTNVYLTRIDGEPRACKILFIFSKASASRTASSALLNGLS